MLVFIACSTRRLADIVPFLNEYGADEDKRALRLPVGRAIHDTMENTAGYIAMRCPEAQAEFDRRYEKYGRTI